jgi:cyclase
MLRRRLIPSLLVDSSGHLVKTQCFNNRVYLGDPLNAAYIFSEYSADELLVLDIDASKENRSIPIEFVKALGKFTSVPLAVGGGISRLSHVEEILAAGVERVVLGSTISSSLAFLSDASRSFGSSSISVIVSYTSCDHNSGPPSPLGPFLSAFSANALEDITLACEDHGCGEIIVYDARRDGTSIGFDVQLFSRLSSRLSVPLVVAGGCGGDDHIINLFNNSCVSGIAIGSNFVFSSNSKQVLLGYPEESSYLRSKINEPQLF